MQTNKRSNTDFSYESSYSRALSLVKEARAMGAGGLLESFVQQFGLDTKEGLAIMCLAEALIRIPDPDKANDLIEDRLSYTNFRQYLGESESLFVNASTWGLLLSGKIAEFGEKSSRNSDEGMFGKVIARVGEPVVRQALKSAMKMIGGQFITAENIKGAIKFAAKHPDFLYSFDMLGEGARNSEQAARYFNEYLNAIRELGAKPGGNGGADIFGRNGISVKLSALHPRLELAKKNRVMAELVPIITELVREAAKFQIPVTMDAEEASRLELTLDIFAETQRSCKYYGFGLAIQAYQKRALSVVKWTKDLSRELGLRLPVRLVKGAYWDSEVKRAQMLGLDDYPVYTEKRFSDISYLQCAEEMLADPELIYPQFATHNALTIASIIELAGDKPYEFQRLHGMGENLYNATIKSLKGRPGGGIACRVYAPVGNFTELLPYLIRRLIENGANSSFVNMLIDEKTPVEELLANPFDPADDELHLPLPADIFAPERKNSKGYELGYTEHLEHFRKVMAEPASVLAALSIIGGKQTTGGQTTGGKSVKIMNPANLDEEVGQIEFADSEAANSAVSQAQGFFAKWSSESVIKRADLLNSAADSLESNIDYFISLLIKEAGKTLADAIGEVREAVDFLRFYASEAVKLMAKPHKLKGYTGESNEAGYKSRGVFVCISPWNFPLAIFTGQIAAALVAGNTVVAKPAEQTSIIAYEMIRLLHDAGIPPQALHLVLGEGKTVGQALCANPLIAGVVFTGSTSTAQAINRALAARDNCALPVLIAETGGQNAMIVDSTVLLEQVADDVISSAFHSAGQRCSALRVLYVQEEIADKFIHLLTGAVLELSVGNPADFATDIGPVIDSEAEKRLSNHIHKMDEQYQQLFHLPEPKLNGHYVTPAAFLIPSMKVLTQEVFGPILHVVRYNSKNIDAVIEEINSSGYGLTLGIHSRIDSFAKYISSRVNAGNIYVNRNMIGAVVGVQPFGGMGLSGTGPKAGGTEYLRRFMSEVTYTVNTAAIGGNLELLS
jgi:RHH-type proline utilization regulon transcriptional repressor/proline dehydrogenase/delta 1-pyrroline-5-carboxylate dehydrogenase